MKRGLFITLEGGEGGGKSTQGRLLREKLEAAGHKAVLTREPGGTPEAEKIRNLLVDRNGGDWSLIAETMLLFAARAMHVRDLIQPSLEAGNIVISDRFTDSTRAYQGYGGNLSQDTIEQLNQVAIDGFSPDLTIILDLPAKNGLDRSLRRMQKENHTEDRYEQKELAFHEKLREGFLDIAKNNPARCIVIDATQSIDDVAAAIWSQVRTRL